MVRLEESRDAPGIFRLHRLSFPTDAEARLVESLRSTNQLILSLAAELDGLVVGHVAFSRVLVGGLPGGAALGPLAVLAEHRRNGIGAQLVQQGLEECRSAGVGWVAVLGDPAYYARFGFRPTSSFGLSDEFNGGSAFQAVELIAGKLPVGGGLVQYAPEFSTVT
jgi:putative acetyltransferase